MSSMAHHLINYERMLCCRTWRCQEGRCMTATSKNAMAGQGSCVHGMATHSTSRLDWPTSDFRSVKTLTLSQWTQTITITVLHYM